MNLAAVRLLDPMLLAPVHVGDSAVLQNLKRASRQSNISNGDFVGLRTNGRRPDTWPVPPYWRVVLAFVGAPAFATALFLCGISIGGVAGPDPIPSFLFAFVLGLIFAAYPLTAVVAVPLFLILRRVVRPSFWACSLAGAAMLCLPLLGLFLFGLVTIKGEPDQSAFGHVSVLHGQPTIWWWLESAVIFGGAAALGSAAGLVFWLIAAAGLKPQPAPDRPEEARD